jgi:hypothetical protein
MLWAIYYGDGSKYTSMDGSPFDAPRTDVQIIAFKNNQMGWEILSQSDYYYYEPKAHCWCIAADQFNVFDVLVRVKKPIILFGRWLSQAAFRKVVLNMLDDLPEPKTLWRKGEPSWLKGV